MDPALDPCRGAEGDLRRGTKRVLKGLGIDAYDAIQALVQFDAPS